MIRRTKIEVWMTDNPEEGEELIKTEDMTKIVEEMKEKLLKLNDRIVIVGMTTSKEE